MPALGLAGSNFVKELLHKTSTGNSPVKTAIIGGEVFDTTSNNFGGATNYATSTTPGDFTIANIDVGVVGVTTTVDAMPNNAPGTFRVVDPTGIDVGGVVHVVDTATGNVGQAVVSHVHRSGSITIGVWTAAAGAALPPGSIVVAAASGAMSPAIVNNKTDSGAGVTNVSGQDIAAFLRFARDLTTTSAVAVAGGSTVSVIQINMGGNNFTANDQTGNTITFTGNITGALAGVSRTISSNGVGSVTLDVALPATDIPAAGDNFVITNSYMDNFIDALMASPGNAGRAADPITGLPTGAITEGPNTGAPANNSNVTPVPADAYMGLFRLINQLGGGANEPNLLALDQMLSDLAGAEAPSSFPFEALAADVTGAALLTTLTIRMPERVGDRAVPRSGTFRLQEDSTTAGAPGLQTHPAVTLPGIAFSRQGDTLTFAAGAIPGATNFNAGARVFLMTGAMNGPKKHGFPDQVWSESLHEALFSAVGTVLGYALSGP